MRSATLHTVVRYTGAHSARTLAPKPVDPARVLAWLANDRERAEAVHTYETTDRHGNGVVVAYAHFGRDSQWQGTDFLTDIYEIPLTALTDR